MQAKIQNLIEKFSALTVKQHKDYNEANTANVFIRPLMEALGWDFSDINEIEAEKAIVKGRVDYVFKTHNVSRFCVEIKALRHELTDEDREQAISYAYNKVGCTPVVRKKRLGGFGGLLPVPGV
jgi:predicted type IV restriction endonuclease